MSRLSRKKMSKRTAKRKSSVQPVLNLKKLEKNFLDMPIKCAGLINKEIKKLHKQITSLEKSKTKQNKQIEKYTKLINKLSQLPTNSARNKQINAAKKASAVMGKSIIGLDKQYQTILKSREEANQTQEKWLAIVKNLKQFDKEWSAKPAKATTAKTSAKVKKSKKPEGATLAIPSTIENVYDNSNTFINTDIQSEENAETLS